MASDSQAPPYRDNETPCPWCKETGARLTSREDLTRSMVCENCGAAGPKKMGPGSSGRAFDAWRARELEAPVPPTPTLPADHDGPEG